MRRHFLFTFFITIFILGARKADSNSGNNSNDEIPCSNYRRAMREFVIKISETARNTNPSFIVIPQNGQNVAWDNDDEVIPDTAFFDAIDGTGREDVFYGMNSYYNIADGFQTPANLSSEIQEMCDVYTAASLTVLATDYTTSNQTKITNSFTWNQQKGYISFAATQRKLNEIPSYEPHNANNDNITSLNEVKNFLYLINPDRYSSKEAFLSALEDTDYDAFIIDLFCASTMLTASDIQRLKTKKSGGSRLIICYMSIGEAEDYRWYWKNTWKRNPPSFLCAENSEWEGNYKVKYWYPQWQNIICGTNGYLSKIIQSGFDGVYLDIIDAFEFFEEQ